jgi:hypothetical protein
MRALALIALLASFAPGMSGQRALSSGPHFAASRPGGHTSGPGVGVSSGFRGRGMYPRRVLYPLGLFSDPFYSDALFSTGYPVAAEPPVIVVQNPPAPETSWERAPAPEQPLMIELRGGQYVRVSGDDSSNAEMIDQKSAEPRRLEDQSTVAVAPGETRDLPPAVLVFRDGHREEISEYTIADGALYTSGDYYAGGSWNRKIELSSLNLPETVSSNRARGVPFRLPAAPNEVVTRP